LAGALFPSAPSAWIARKHGSFTGITQNHCGSWLTDYFSVDPAVSAVASGKPCYYFRFARQRLFQTLLSIAGFHILARPPF
jgi:hypothetical protein